IIRVLNMESIIPDYEIIGNPKSFVDSELSVQKALCDNTVQSSSSGHNNNLAAQNRGRNVHNFRPTVQPAYKPPPVYKGRLAVVKNKAPAQNRGRKVQNFRPTVQPAYKPPPVFKGRRAVVKNKAPARVIPIADLNQYQGRWAIKARVTAKGDLRRY
ncbi:replication protein A 70 kDa dna-binding subunit A-like, partial [Trifolium medium]|nr:replication protein A 70 kDa dna-binding subunit A-like [Trifolium medium]